MTNHLPHLLRFAKCALLMPLMLTIGSVRIAHAQTEPHDSMPSVAVDAATGEYSTLRGMQELEQRNIDMQQALDQEQLKQAYWLVGGALGVIVLLMIWQLQTIYSRRKLKLAFQQTKRALEIRTNFIRNIQHEIRTPLNSIMGFSQVLSDMNASNPEYREMTDIIADKSMQLTEIIDHLIDVAEIDSRRLQLTTCSAANVVADVVAHSQHYPGIEVSLAPMAIRGGKTPFVTDEGLLRKALMLVITNAVKFVKQGHIVVGCEEQGSLMRFIVTDDGPGIPADKQEWVFEQFTKLNEFTTGTGLGLPLCRSIAQRLGGTARVDGSYSPGCRMLIEVAMTLSDES